MRRGLRSVSRVGDVNMVCNLGITVCELFGNFGLSGIL